jgi:hypothetical protein
MRKFSQLNEGYHFLDFDNQLIEQNFKSLPSFKNLELDIYLMRIGSNGSCNDIFTLTQDILNFDEETEYMNPMFSYLIEFKLPEINSEYDFNWINDQDPLEMFEAYPINNLFEQLEKLKGIIQPYQKDFFILINQDSYNDSQKNTEIRNGQFSKIRIEFTPRDLLTYRQAKQILNI